MNRFFRIVWSINGILLLGVLLAMGIILIKELLPRTDYWSREIIVGDDLAEARAKGLILQGITFEEPQPVAHSDGYLLPVSLKTYRTPRKSYDLASASNFEGGAPQNWYDQVNVIFLNKDFEPMSVLLDRKAFINSMRFPGREMTSYYDGESADTLQRCITYLIAFEDTNQDGAINEWDDADLYFSDLQGNNLTQITKGFNVLSYRFITKDRILIKYEKREEGVDAEHLKSYLALYSLEEKSLRDLTGLQKALDDLELMLTK